MTTDEQTPAPGRLHAQIAEALGSWSAERDVSVARHDGEGVYWAITPKDAANGGSITVMIRRNQHGPIEVIPANDLGHFARYGATVRSLTAALDQAMRDLESVEWTLDPMQGMP